MAAGEFREDLYFRLSVFPIYIPPLRDRHEGHPGPGETLPGAAAKLPDAADVHLSKPMFDELQSVAPWVGNVRRAEKRHRARAAIVAGPLDTGTEHLPRPPPAGRPAVRQRSGKSRDRIARWTEAEGQASGETDSTLPRALRPLPRDGRAAALEGVPSPRCQRHLGACRRPGARHPPGDASPEAPVVWPRLRLAQALADGTTGNADEQVHPGSIAAPR